MEGNRVYLLVKAICPLMEINQIALTTEELKALYYRWRVKALVYIYRGDRLVEEKYKIIKKQLGRERETLL